MGVKEPVREISIVKAFINVTNDVIGTIWPSLSSPSQIMLMGSGGSVGG